MRTLYISDLDGTLLDRNGRLSETTRQILTGLLGRGLPFTIATARTPLSVRPLFKDLALSYPVVLMSGAALLDPHRWEILEATPLSGDAAAVLARAEAAFDLHGLLFTANHDQVDIALGCPPDTHWEAFFGRNHADIRDPRLLQGNAAAYGNRPVLYGTYMDCRPERLRRFCDFLADYPGFALDFYQDVYDRGTWCLELCSSDASKECAVHRLREITGFERLAAFGDGQNDIPLFRACDQRFAVNNACLELKAMADKVIGNHWDDSVAHCLEEVFL